MYEEIQKPKKDIFVSKRRKQKAAQHIYILSTVTPYVVSVAEVWYFLIQVEKYIILSFCRMYHIASIQVLTTQ